ncbi:MAG: hypothetical protein PHS41_02965 [Victivallaceae bacterium]|nr:hypothetical protein [Victivallaceae bacterium]
MKKSIVGCFVMILGACVLYAAPIRIEKQVRSNPALAVNVSDPAIASELTGLLRACGWFNVVPGKEAEYVLEGGNGNFALKSGTVDVGRWRIAADGTSARERAKLLADAALKKLFSVSGLPFTRIAFCVETKRGVKNLFYCDVDGKNLVRLTNFTTTCVEPCWLPHGRSIGYTRYTLSSTEIVESTIDPVRSRRLAAFPGMNVGVAFSPSGNSIAFLMSRDHRIDLYVKDIASNQLRRLTNDRCVEASPAWSPDGRELVYVSDASGRPALYRCSPTGHGKRRLPTIGSESYTPAWSNDNQIAYVAKLGGNIQLTVLDLKTNENRVATPSMGNWESPSWSPDNRHLVCSRTDGGRQGIYIVDTWTGKVRPLLRTKFPMTMPCWSNPAR